MNRRKHMFVAFWAALILLASMAAVLAIDYTDNAAAQAVIRVGAAAGVKVAAGHENDPYAYLDAFVAKKVISKSLANKIRLYIANNKPFPTELFVIFLADILNGGGKTPNHASAVKLLQAYGIKIPTGKYITIPEISAILSDLELAQALYQRYQSPISPTQP